MRNRNTIRTFDHSFCRSILAGKTDVFRFFQKRSTKVLETRVLKSSGEKIPFRSVIVVDFDHLEHFLQKSNNISFFVLFQTTKKWFSLDDKLYVSRDRWSESTHDTAVRDLWISCGAKLYSAMMSSKIPNFSHLYPIIPQYARFH